LQARAKHESQSARNAQKNAVSGSVIGSANMTNTQQQVIIANNGRKNKKNKNFKK